MRKTTLNKRMSEEIKNMRLQSGFSQKYLSQKMHTSQSSLCKYETGERVPGIYFLKKYCYFFDTPLDQFFKRVGA